MKKRIVSVISWLLAAAMLVSMPVCAFAEEDSGSDGAAQTASVPETDNNGGTGSGNSATGENSTTGENGTTWEDNTTGGEKPASGSTTEGGSDSGWKNDAGFVGFSAQLVDATNAYSSFDGKTVVGELKAKDAVYVMEQMTTDKEVWWKIEGGRYIRQCHVNKYETVPTPVNMYPKDSVATLIQMQTARQTSPNSNTSAGSFDKGYSFVILETQKYGFDVWGKADLGKDGIAWFNLAYALVEEPGSSTGSTGSTGSAGTSSGVATGVIANVSSSVNVRSLPSISGNKVGTLNVGAEVTIYETKLHERTGAVWARIGEDEWVCMDYIKVTSGSVDTEEETKPEESDKTETPKKKGVVANCTNLNVRSAPSTSGNMQGRLPVGTEVSIYEIVTKHGVEWGRIGEDKWVSLQYVQIIDENPGASDSDKEDNGDDTTVAETPIASGTVTSNMNLKVRTGAGTNFPIKTSLVKGSKISIYATKTVNGTQWGRIGKDQWVCLSYVNIDSGNVGDSSTDSSTSSTSNATIVNCSTGVNVRATPSVTGAFVARINVNTRVYISETKKATNGTKWGKVDNGWVCMDYVKMDDDASVDDGSGTVSSTVGASYANITVPATVQSRATVWVNAGKDSEKDEYLLVLGDGTEINITGRALANDNQWGKVNVNGLTGWVNMNNISLKDISATVSAAQANAYQDHSTDSKREVVWGKGQEVTIVSQYTDGTYLWGQDSTTGYWVNMASLAIKPDNSGTDNTPAATISIVGKVKGSADVYNKDGSSLLTLKKDTKVEITDLKYENGVCMGRVTINNVAVKPITGWVYLDDISQTAVSGKVSVDVATLYRTLSGQKASLSLKMNNSVNILERTKAADGTVYGKLKINNAFYWIKMSNVSLNGTGGATNIGSTGNTGSTGTAGNVGNTGTETPTGTTNVPGVVKSTYVNVRSEASARSRQVTQLKQGTKVTVYEQIIADGAAWGKIDQGWVAMEYIDLSSRPTAAGGTVSNTTIMTSVPAGAVGVGFVNYDGLAIRSGAGAGFDKVGTLKKGTNVVITEQKLTGGMIWGKIDKGWICTSYVTMTGAGITGSGSTGTIARCAYTVNVRNNPGVGSALVAKILVNSRVEILETKIYSGEQWGRTSLGWVSMQYVLMDN